MHIKKERPLVSILIYNYNYGQYLRHCFDSAVNQTYQNTEILFSDNNSNDDSWEIALEYNKKYSGNFFICKNRDNFGTDANLHNIKVNLNGEYFVVLCSDDALEPTFIEKTMESLVGAPLTLTPTKNFIGFIVGRFSMVFVLFLVIEYLMKK